MEERNVYRDISRRTDGDVSVSYTHLDVYKRQHLRCTREESALTAEHA